MITIDLENNAGLQFRIDSFNVPAESRDEFVQAMHRNLSFIDKLPGFLGHVVFEKTAGPANFNLVTIAVWESAETIESAGASVREYYRSIGFDVQETLARLGVSAEIGNYDAPAGLQAHANPAAAAMDLAPNP